jgi:hypothetical protein
MEESVNGAPYIILSQGTTPVFTATATTLPPGSQATVNLTGTAFTFGIPSGQPGATGPTGPAGPVQSFTSLTCAPASLNNTAGFAASGCAEK